MFTQRELQHLETGQPIANKCSDRLLTGPCFSLGEVELEYREETLWAMMSVKTHQALLVFTFLYYTVYYCGK